MTDDHSTIPLKKCTKCHREYPSTADYFFRHKKAKDGFCPRCKDCDNPGHFERQKERERLKRDGLRKCTICGQEKPEIEEYFYTDKSKPGGWDSHCKECTYLDYQSNRHKKQAYHLANREHILARFRKFYTEHWIEIQLKKRQDYRLNRDKYLTYARNYRLRHPDRLAEQKQKFHRTHRHLSRMARQRRRARINGLPSDITAQDWQRCLIYFNYSCAVCGRPRGLWHTLAADHWIPLNHQNCPGTVTTNIVPLCHGQGGCNNSKGSKPPEQWLAEHYGKKKAVQILKRIQTYFDTL